MRLVCDQDHAAVDVRTLSITKSWSGIRWGWESGGGRMALDMLVGDRELDPHSFKKTTGVTGVPETVIKAAGKDLRHRYVFHCPSPNCPVNVPAREDSLSAALWAMVDNPELLWREEYVPHHCGWIAGTDRWLPVPETGIVPTHPDDWPPGNYRIVPPSEEPIRARFTGAFLLHLDTLRHILTLV
ncbi:hypothetical protein GCM10009788_52470 [Nocardioides humi]|uniref:Uncharacterized protein n=1 Tax=Nocardioides humi TaxID=449461 RepID=A0ABN2BM34_9ACTN